ncbi:MAG: topoisomerase DNA-binding C4 zinc finger domain-containing protein, partial [Planctomycetota bacterium]
MLHGLKITSEAKALLRGGKEHKARLVFDETYRVCLAPKSRAVEREETQEVCPNCGAKIYLITKGDGSKHYGCAGFPKCTYASKYVPHTFNRDAVVQQDSRPSQAEAEKAAPVQHEEQIAVPAPANPAAPAAKSNPAPRAPEAVAPKQDVEAGPLLDASGAPAD